jgi:Cu+-exporting ATPase
MVAEIRGAPQAGSLTIFAAILQGAWLAVGLADDCVRAGLHRVINARGGATPRLGEEDVLFVRHALHFAGAWSPGVALVVACVVALNSSSWELGFSVAAALLMILQFRPFLLAARQAAFSAACKAEDAGIRFRDAVSYESLGRVDVCAFSTRGVVYVGLPEVTEVHSFGGATDARVLQLAGAVAGAADGAVEQGIERALKIRGLAPETVRGVRCGSTGAVSALDASAQRIVFGTRTQLVEERFSVAVADERATEHEEQSRTVYLVALGDRVVGTVALQSVLRSEVRSAVRSLLELHIEPILMSEESADAVAALARGLGITHIRAELPAKARANAMRDLARGGRTVAVIGLQTRDAEPMLAAHAAIALDVAGAAGGSTPYAATLASADMRAAVRAISLPRALREQLPRALTMSVLPPLLALALTAFDLVPLALVPLATLAGLAATLLYSRWRAPL